MITEGMFSAWAWNTGFNQSTHKPFGGERFMKKSVLFILMIMSAFAAVPVAASAEDVATLTRFEGAVDITPRNQQAVPAVKDMGLAVGDIIRTKTGARAEVVFMDGSSLHIAEKTRIEITEYMFDANESKGVFNLFRGKVFSIIKKTGRVFGLSKKNQFEVRTQTAVVGVRGTRFITYFQENISGAVFEEGAGYCYSLNQPDAVRYVEAGQAMMVSNPYRPPVVRPFTESEMQRHLNDVTPSGEGEDSEGIAGGGAGRGDRAGGPGERGPGGGIAGIGLLKGPMQAKALEDIPGNVPAMVVKPVAMTGGGGPGTNVEPPRYEPPPLIVTEGDAPTADIPPCELDFLTSITFPFLSANQKPAGDDWTKLSGLSDHMTISAGADGGAWNISVSEGERRIQIQTGSTMTASETVLLKGRYAKSAAGPANPWVRPASSESAGISEIRNIDQSIWSDRWLIARGEKAWVNLSDMRTGVSSGELAGRFDPNDNTWRAAEHWKSVETSRFLTLTANDAGRKKLEELNIPCVTIGKASLTGRSDKLTVNMNDVTFFGYSTGAAPKIWAAGDVNGDWRNGPEAGHTVNLSGGGLNADFSVTNWDSRQWKADVTGNGALNRTDVSGTVNTRFSGFAGGQYSGEQSGQFQGTAAGIVTP